MAPDELDAGASGLWCRRVEFGPQFPVPLPNLSFVDRECEGEKEQPEEDLAREEVGQRVRGLQQDVEG